MSSLKDNNDIFLKALSQLILDIADYQHFEMPDIVYNKPDIRKFMKTLTNAGPQNYDVSKQFLMFFFYINRIYLRHMDIVDTPILPLVRLVQQMLFWLKYSTC